MSLDYIENPELREEGKRAANQLIAVIEGSGDERAKNKRGLAYIALGNFAEAEKTENGYAAALSYYEKLLDIHKSQGNKMGEKSVEICMDAVKSKRDGESEKPYSAELLESMRDQYEYMVKEHGENSSAIIQAGLNLINALYRSGGEHDFDEGARLSNKLAIISHRVHGPDHPMTKAIGLCLQCQVLNKQKNEATAQNKALIKQNNELLMAKTKLMEEASNLMPRITTNITLQFENSKKKHAGVLVVGTIAGDDIELYEALSYNEEEGKYTVKGPLSDTRIPDEEIVSTVTINDIVLGPGTPVFIHGLEKSPANGKAGIVKVRDDRTGTRTSGCYVVYLEEENVNAWFRPENLRLVFDKNVASSSCELREE